MNKKRAISPFFLLLMCAIIYALKEKAMKKIRLISLLLALTLVGCNAKGNNSNPGQKDDPSQTDTDSSGEGDKNIPVSSISLNPTSLTLTEGDKSNLEVTVQPENATYENIEWSTGDERVASVHNGEVSANTKGETTITASIGDKTATCAVTVNAKPVVDPDDFISTVKLSAHSDFQTFENTTFLQDKISLVALDYVEDGDTVHFKEGENSLTIRMAYIDTPSDIESWGHEAMSSTRALMAQAKTIVITNKSLSSTGSVDLDSTGERYVGFIWYSRKENATINDLRCLNLDLVNEGYSKSFSKSGDPLYDQFSYCENIAKEAKKNIWSDPVIDPTTDYGYDHYDGYYGKLKWNNSEDLIIKLNAIIHDGYQALTYDDPNWETNTYADHSYDDFEYLDVVYSEENIFASNTQKGWQREHAFAASLMTGSQTGSAVKYPGRSTDFHNLFAAHATGNNSRNNKNFGLADPTASGYQDKTTNNGLDGYKCDSKIFEPATKDKGRIARAIFYMATMYKDDELDTYNNILMKGLTIQEEIVEYSAGNCKFAIGGLSTLLSWSDDVAVDYLEMQHNESVYSHVYAKRNIAQGNRNPYVDYPELVSYAFGSKKDQSGDLKNLKPASVDLESESKEFSHYAIKEAKREFTYGETLTSSDYSIVKVAKDYSYTDYTGSVQHSYLNHEFVEGDGEGVNASVTVGEQVIKYPINLDPLKTCSYYSEMKKTGISNAYADIGKDNNVTYGEKDFTININVTASEGSKWTITDKSDGGFIMGSSTYSVNKVTLKTVNSYTVDKLYMSLRTGNKNSSYTIKMYVGSELIYTGSVTDNSMFYTRGIILSEVKTGIISYVFEGSNALWLRYVAFNEVK